MDKDDLMYFGGGTCVTIGVFQYGTAQGMIVLGALLMFPQIMGMATALLRKRDE